jgi:hypothetical protein
MLSTVWHHVELIGIYELLPRLVHNVAMGGVSHVGGAWIYSVLVSQPYK